MDPWLLALPRILSGFLNLLLGGVVFFARPARRQNQLLAVMLSMNFTINLGIGLVPLVTHEPSRVALIAPTLLSMVLYVSAYLLFTGTLDTPLTRPFRTKWGVAGVAAAAAAMTVSLFAARQLWYAPVQPWPAGRLAVWPAFFQSFALHNLLELIILAHFVFGMVAAIHAFRRAKTPSERRKMKWWVIAFGTFDSLLALSFAMEVAAYSFGNACETCTVVNFYGTVSVASVLLALFLAYGILTTQLFDIEIRVKRGISRSTLVAVFLAVFVGVAAAAEEYLSDRYGLLIGGAAAAALVFALAPLQRFSDRVANAAMPDVHDTAEYRMVRKREVFRAAVDSARLDGEVTAKERNVLATLADQLGLSSTEALAIEQEATGTPGGDA